VVWSWSAAPWAKVGYLGAALSLASVRVAAQDTTAASEPDVVETVMESDGQRSDEADSTETVTESVAQESLDWGGPAAPAPAASGEEENRTKVTGWARESLELYPYDDGLRRDDPMDASGVPRDRLISNTQLSVRATYQRGRWFEATVSGVLGVSVNVEGSGQDLPLRSFESQGTVEFLDARLMELYFGFFFRSLDIRLGQQRVAWGVADVLSPNDVVNARDLRDPFMNELELNHVPTPMLRLDWELGPLVLEGLVSPFFVPDRASLYGRNWSAIQPDSPAAYRGLFSVLGRGFDPTVRDQVNAALYQTRSPNHDGQGITAGAKLGLHTSALDANFYYHYGYDGTPYIWVDPAFATVLNTTDFARSSLSDLAPVLQALDRGLTPFLAEYVRRHHVGFDAVIGLGPFMLRLDAAYQSQRVFYRADLTSVARPAVLGVLSIDYQTGSIDKVLVLEGVYVRVLGDVEQPLLIYQRDSYGLAGILRWPLFSVFHLEARVLGGIAPRFYTVQPALLLKLKQGFQIKAGALLLGGEPYSFGGYYRYNTTAFLQLRYGF
jgi:hypothetical protein